MRPDCKKCNTQLSGPVIDGLTTCPGCGKRWELTPDLTAIKTTTLIVQSVEHVSKTQFTGVKHNG